MPKLIMTVGLPGTGKRKFVENNFPDFEIISFDDLVEDFAERQGLSVHHVYDTMDLSPLMDELFDNFKTAVANNRNIAVVMTSMSEKSRKRWPTSDNYTRIALVFTHPDERIGKADGRTYMDKLFTFAINYHGRQVPFKTIVDMNRRYSAPRYAEGFHAIYKIQDVSW